jgi:DNA-binding CsgD family transcriptional regulator/PAS domain-containing protein
MGALSKRTLSALIGSIYDCAIDPSRWEQTLAGVAEALQGEKAILCLNDLEQDRVLIEKSVGWEPRWLEERAKHLAEVHHVLRPWLMQRSGLDEPFVATREIPANQLETAPYVRECLRPQGIADVAHFFLIATPIHYSELALFWQDRHGPMTEREIELGGLLLPHLRRAVTISNVLDIRTIEHARMAEALDVLRHGVVLTNEAGAVLHANRSAEQMVQTGGPIGICGGMLRAKSRHANGELRKAIQLAANDESQIGKTGTAIRLTEPDVAPIFAHVLPMTGGELRTRLQPSAAAAVFIEVAPDRPSSSLDAVAAGFQLTPAETRVLAGLVSGRTLAETADDLGIARTTARTHLDSIFRKTGTSRQAELMILTTRLASLP